MSAESRLPPARAYLERAESFTRFMTDVRTSLGLTHRELAAEITEAAYELNQVASTVHASAVWRWERGVVAQEDVRRWIAYVLQKRGIDVSEADLGALAQAQKRARRVQQRPQEYDQAADQTAVSIERSDIDIPVYGTLPSLPTQGSEDEFTMMRRQFLQWLLSFAGTSVVTPTYVPSGSGKPADDFELFAHECGAQMHACWRLMQGRDMIVLPTLLMSWLPSLESLVRQRSPHQRQLAAIAAEGYMLSGLVTVLQGHHDRAEWCCRQAVEYATLAHDPNLTVAALKHLATKYLSARYPLLTLRTYQQAVPYLDHVSPLLRGRIHLGLALAYAQVGNQPDAEQQLELAHATFPAEPERDPAFIYADARRASLNHYGGLIHLALDRPLQAWETFAAAAPVEPSNGVPERTAIQIINCQAEAALALRDLDLATTHLEAAGMAGRDLGSPKRFRDTAKLYGQLRTGWPSDPRVKRLESLFRTDDRTLVPGK
jgi:hypothetical protein